jgi:tetratricopeptide (TPR) repeat protein
MGFANRHCEHNLCYIDWADEHLDCIDHHFRWFLATPSPMDSNSARIERGIAAGRAGDFNRARDSFTAVLALEPRNTRALSLRADANRISSDYESAIRDYTALLEVEPQDIRAKFGRALSLAFLFRAEESVLDINAGMADHVAAGVLYYQMSMSHRIMIAGDQFPMADAPVHDLDDLYERLAFRGRILAELGDRSAREIAVCDWTVAVAIRPTEMDALRSRALAWTSRDENPGKKDMSRSADDFCLVARREPSERSVGAAAWALYEAERSAEALPLADELVRRQPNDPMHRSLRCGVLEELRQWQAALRDAEVRIRLLSDDDESLASAYFSRGRIVHALGSFRRAIDDFTESLRLDPGVFRIEVLMARASSHRMIREDKEAEDDLTAATVDDRVGRICAPAFVARAELYMDRGNVASAIQDFESALSLNPDLESARERLAGAYEIAGYVARAAAIRNSSHAKSDGA